MAPAPDDETPIGGPKLPPSTTDLWVGKLGTWGRFLRGLAPVVGCVWGGWLLITDPTGMSCSYSAKRKVHTLKVNLVDQQPRLLRVDPRVGRRHAGAAARARRRAPLTTSCAAPDSRARTRAIRPCARS
jgi:hypothetical protein